MFNDNNFFSGGSASFYPTEISQSLRFNDDDAAYLQRTMSTPTASNKWAWSAWVKRGNLSTTQMLFTAGVDGDDYDYIQFNTSNQLAIFHGVVGGTSGYVLTPALFRDTSAWYHIVVTFDGTATFQSERVVVYVNGVIQPLTISTLFSATTYINTAIPHAIGVRYRPPSSYDSYFDGYLAEVHFTDGTAYTADAFGEFKSGVWVAKQPSVTYGTNGFYLNFASDYAVEGFNTVTYTGNGSTQYIGGVGFSPDLVWIKNRSGTNSHQITDSVRGATLTLFSDGTFAEETRSTQLTSFESDGFITGSGAATNTSGNAFVAWAWDAGTGSPVSNTNGTITSTVKANPAYGFSIVSYTGIAQDRVEHTVGHGLSSAPEMIIVKNRSRAPSSSVDWPIYHVDRGSAVLYLNAISGGSVGDWPAHFNSLPTSSVFSVRSDSTIETTVANRYRTTGAADNYIAYCFHSVAGYSKMGSYTGNGSSTGPVVTTGFKPAMVLIKRTDSTGNWTIMDNTRDPVNPIDRWLYPNSSAAEATSGWTPCDMNADGFQIKASDATWNASGGTYIYMAFADTREAGFFLDQSGNNNDFEPVVLTESDVSLDSPTNNFATMSPIAHSGTQGGLLQEGNLYQYNGTDWNQSTMQIPSTGKYYVEVLYQTVVTIIRAAIGTDGSDSVGIAANGTVYDNGVAVGTYTAPSNGSIVGYAVDADANEIKIYVNGTLVLTRTTTATLANSYICAITGGTYHIRFNFGQDSSFAGTKTPQGNTDANGLGDFYYAPPTGYLALCTANLPEPAISPLNSVQPSQYFNTVTYTGAGDPTSITGVGFQPDFIWFKSRSQASHHVVHDVIRGPDGRLYPSFTFGESFGTWNPQSFDADGFTGTNTNEIATLGQTFVAWSWKAGGTPVTNTNGTITSSVSANTESGFSIATYTGNSGVSPNVGHGLSQAPELFIIKNRAISSGWVVYFTVVDGTVDFMYLDKTNASGDGAVTPPTSTISHVFNGSETNGNGQSHVMYSFHSVEGFSKIGTYTGNGSADGPFVYTGFRPAFVMIKRTDTTANWGMFDNERLGYNVRNDILYPNLANAEGSAEWIDFTSNGFKLRFNHAQINASGGTYIYMAFAENPFKYSNAR